MKDVLQNNMTMNATIIFVKKNTENQTFKIDIKLKGDHIMLERDLNDIMTHIKRVHLYDYDIQVSK